ncbi:MAG: hypothetical protein ACFFCS_24155 [Candidatus Hodarchaeota archaeon]
MLQKSCVNTFISGSSANLVAIRYAGVGGILPSDNESLSMTLANVVLDIDATDHLHSIGVQFDGNYTVMNTNETKNVTIGAPFSPSMAGLGLACTVTLNGTPVPFEILDNVSLNSTVWLKYTHSIVEQFITCNVTVPENGSVVLRYTINASIVDLSDEVMIDYIVGTARAWSGNVTELVTFNVKGTLPHAHSDYLEGVFEKHCTVQDITGGRSYSWSWNDEAIEESSVYVAYHYEDPPPSISWLLVALISITAFAMVPVIFLLLKRRRGK